eukprot:3649885-Pyramimonas_sp.AAC.1
MNLFALVMASLDLEQDVADAKSAFTQSRKLQRANGPLYAEPREGVRGAFVEEGCLIELEVAVYGLDDAPLEWSKTLTSTLSEA